MNYQEHMIEASRKAAEEFFKYAKSVPADKLEWAPMDAGRSVISLCQEIAMTPTWGHDVIAGDPSKWTEGDREEQGKMMKGWTTVADCEREFNARFEKLAALYRSLPDAELEKTKWLPTMAVAISRLEKCSTTRDGTQTTTSAKSATSKPSTGTRICIKV